MSAASELDSFVSVGTLLVAYYATDVLVRRRGFKAALRKVGFGTLNAELAVAMASMTALAWFLPWSEIPGHGSLRVVSVVLSGMLAWKIGTQDIDLGAGRALWGSRLLLIATAFGSYYSPAFLIAAVYVLTASFDTWQHHATMPMRIMQLIIGYVAFAALAPEAATASHAESALLFLIVVMQVSHYFITGLAKGYLGPRWYSWMLDNRLHHIVASAYSWGWGRFVPWPVYRRFVHVIRAGEVPMQVAAFAVEALAPLALLDPDLALALCVAWSLFHLLVFVSAGIFFWDWIVTNAAVAFLIWSAPAGVAAQSFGVWPLVAGLVVMGIWPLRHKLWKPMPLGWYDTPFTQRVHWKVIGESGTEYGLYNSFMCPHERVYGRVHGCFFVPERVFTYHLGEVWKPEIRDAIIDSGGDPDKLERIRASYGIDVSEPTMAEQHVDYLRRFFARLNRGAQKSVLPRGLGWLKAPGGQFFNGGDLPAYRRQEPIRQVELLYREEFFDGTDIRRIKNDTIIKLDISDELDPGYDVEDFSAKELDDMLISRATGVLFDLPSFGNGYVHADDGGNPTGMVGPATPSEGG